MQVTDLAFAGYPVTEMDRARRFYGETLKHSNDLTFHQGNPK